MSQTDITVEIDEFSVLEPIEGAFGKPFYLVGFDTFAEGDDAYPQACAVM